MVSCMVPGHRVRVCVVSSNGTEIGFPRWSRRRCLAVTKIDGHDFRHAFTTGVERTPISCAILQ